MKKCSRCKGEGAVWMKVRNPRDGSSPADPSRVVCPAPTCKNGFIDPQLELEYRKSWADWGKPSNESLEERLKKALCQSL